MKENNEFDVLGTVAAALTESVNTRLKVMHILNELREAQSIHYDTARDELEDAVDKLYEVEVHLGNACRDAIIGYATELAEV